MKSLLIIIFMLSTSFCIGQHKYVVKVQGQSGAFEGGTTINGTGFVKASGTTISYDSTTYVSQAVANATYSVLPGKSGGQVLNGGTGAGENLQLFSTSNATKGKIYLGNYSYYNDVTGELVLANSNNTNQMFLNPDENIFGMQVNGNPGDFEFSGGSIEFHTVSNLYFNGNIRIAGAKSIALGKGDGSGSTFAYTNLDSATNVWFWNINDNWVFKINPNNGNVGIGNTSNYASARLEIQSSDGTAGNAPLKFNAGTNLDTPENGTVEFDGTNYSVTSNGLRYTLTKTLKGTAAPAITPESVGIQYVDTNNKKIYISTGTTSSADWTVIN